MLATASSGGAGRPSRDCGAGTQEKKVRFNGSKSHRLWYAAVGRKAKKEIVVDTLAAQEYTFHNRDWEGSRRYVRHFRRHGGGYARFRA